MACDNNCYLPNPPRAWSRVQHSCSFFDNLQQSNFNTSVVMLNKGNILQYKKNSSNLTKQQGYSQIAKGQWTNRNTTWATQSTRGYTNPNNLSLQRANSTNVTLANIPTTEPVTCPKPKNIINNILPSGSSGGSANPEVIPPPPPPPPVPITPITMLPPAIIEPPIQPIVIQNFGTLICGTQENICTGKIIRQPTDVICHPTTDSDVPGQITELCWNDGTPTWYPKQQYVMTNSGNKWPVNAILLSSIKPSPPVITSIFNVESIVTITWTQDTKCLSVTNFTIFQNELPIKIVSSDIFIDSIVVENNATYTFFIVGNNGNIVSEPSNIVSITLNN